MSPTASPPQVNDAEFSVSELPAALKRTVENNFSHVRVRAELGRVTFHGNGHVYLDLKDDKAVLNGVVWRGSVSKLKIRPEQGLEVIATGRLTTFAGRSQYQMVIEQIEPAGVGALMALLEERRKKLAAEGLFAEDRKKPLPTLPEVIGVITSPTGAVIRDILHRLADRFPRHVLLWPVMVQGDAAAAQVSAAIEGFNKLKVDGEVPRPDVLIVARGGGSVEDLWPFNEEIVVRAVAASTTPIISAVGHETDTTLIDFASDRRAPTPTAAAEMAVPVRSDLEADLHDRARRLARGLTRALEDRRMRLTSLVRALPRAGDLVAQARQRLDYAENRLGSGLEQGALRHRSRFDRLATRLRPEALGQDVSRRDDKLKDLSRRMAETLSRDLTRRQDRLDGTAKLLRTLSYQGTLARGYSLVRSEDGTILRSTKDAQAGQAIQIDFHDGSASARIEDSTGKPTPPQKKSKSATSKPPPPKAKPGQGNLF
jgi:exodeoxyribonuclease VII large subunit